MKSAKPPQASFYSINKGRIRITKPNSTIVLNRIHKIYKRKPKKHCKKNDGEQKNQKQ